MIRKRLLFSLIVVAVVACFLPLAVEAQGGFESWLSINMTGISDSWLVLGRQGVSDSRFYIGISALLAPTNLTLIAIGDYEVYASWVKGVGANNTMVRAALGRIPTDRDDGYLVYYGAGTNATDYNVDLNDGRRWYRAWSQGSGGGWEENGIWAYIGGEMILLILFGIMALGLTGMFFWKRSQFLAYGAAGSWALLGFQSFVESGSTNPTNITDTYMAMFWLCVAFVIGCALLPTVMREKPTKEDIYVEDIDGSDLSAILPERGDEKKDHSRQPKSTKFAETGKI